MQRYVIQLISDIEVAIQHAPPVSEYATQPLFNYEENEEGMSFASDAQLVQLYDLFSLHALAFPPESRLNRSQVTALLRSIETLWSAYQISWDFPHNLSARKRYIAMTEKMQNGSVLYSLSQGAEIDFCEERRKCPFGDSGQCTCREVEKTVEQDMALWDKLNPLIDGEGEGAQTNEIENVHRWLDADFDLPPWFIDEKSERWSSFVDKSEDMEWLYFYRPDGAEEAKGLYPYELDDEPDFDDFEWDGSTVLDEGLFLDDDDEDDLYFGDGDLPF